MSINLYEIEKLEGEFKHLVDALKNGYTVEVNDEVNEDGYGWCEVSHLNVYRPASDYRVISGE